MTTTKTISGLRLRRQSFGLSIKELSALCGIPDSIICQYENGLVPPEKRRAAYATALQFTQKELMDVVEGKKRPKVVFV